MNRFMAATFLTLFGLFVYAPPSLAQQEQAKSARKIVSRIMPRYPEMARTMNRRGSVKAEALVRPEWRGEIGRRERRTSGAGAGGAGSDLQVEMGALCT